MSAIISTTYHTSLSLRSHTTYVARELERHVAIPMVVCVRHARYGLTNVIALIDAVLYLLLSHVTATFQLSFKWNLKKRAVRVRMIESKSNRSNYSRFNFIPFPGAGWNQYDFDYDRDTILTLANSATSVTGTKLIDRNCVNVTSIGGRVTELVSLICECCLLLLST